MFTRSLLVWFLIAAAEALHGALRVAWLNRRVGDHRARQIGVFTGSALILWIAALTVPWIGAASLGDCLAVGAIWLVLMLAFDITFGRMVFLFSWSRIAADFDFRRGGMLGVGMLILFLSPLLAAKWRGLL